MNGSDAKRDDYPFIVYLYNSGDKEFCGGSLIDTSWVLTAAHCVKGGSASTITVFVGQAEYKLDISKGSKVTAVHSHPQYNDQNMNNDIALIKLEKPVSGKNVGVIAIDQGTVGDGETLTALGWGYTSPSGSKPSKKLQKGDLKTLSQKQCGAKHTSFAGNNGPQICVAADAGPDTCPGDSGGPLIRSVGGSNVLTGITSFGTAGPGQPITVNCGGKGMISLFTHPKHFMSFINTTTGGLRNTEPGDSSDG
ncbi:hypothetical protein H4R19_001091 [Coemansia spiralis]|nr:hypothetical protein H4R19_001091 [Coemansia spiralis]